MRSSKRLRARLRADDGGVVVFVAICTVALLGLIGIILEGGGKMRATERADAVAMEAARAGGQALDPAGAVTGTRVRADPAAATAAAYAYLSSTGVSGRVSASADGRKLTVTSTTPTSPTSPTSPRSCPWGSGGSGVLMMPQPVTSSEDSAACPCAGRAPAGSSGS